MEQSILYRERNSELRTSTKIRVDQTKQNCDGHRHDPTVER